MNPGILIAAAGLGSRYRHAGGRGLKLEQNVAEGLSVFQRTLRQACAAGFPVHVVTRSDYTGLQASCRQAGVPFTCHNTDSLGDTIAQGVNDCRSWDGWLIQLADMPFVSTGTHRAVALALERHSTARPFYRNLPGHPVGFADNLRQDLLQLKAGQGAREILQRYPPYKIQVADEGVVSDIDLPLSHHRE